ncbi:hypothetical protein [Nocardia terpenica]|uniref:Uncharacterized protein n=1 Tax=Nocardia terpenica TaxID=455432 RepID=A0A291RH19_9NOCA|nr:hypothetical protein [Nocardia terpenica]ATL66883.1 hypothetical protein CRH09_12345 [Nocardia terpenica]
MITALLIPVAAALAFLALATPAVLIYRRILPTLTGVVDPTDRDTQRIAMELRTIASAREHS